MRAVNKKVKTQHGRPLTYDFLKNSVEELGFKARTPLSRFCRPCTCSLPARILMPKLARCRRLKLGRMPGGACKLLVGYRKSAALGLRCAKLYQCRAAELGWGTAQGRMRGKQAEACGWPQVAAVQVTAFINNTYHSLVQYESRAPGAPLVAVDSRPSDAINLAMRFGAPIYVHKKASCPLHLFPSSQPGTLRHSSKRQAWS